MARRFRNIAGTPEDVFDGRVIGHGETFEMDNEQVGIPYNQNKIDEGKFIEEIQANTDASTTTTSVPEQTKRSRQELVEKAKDLKIQVPTKMSNEELSEAIAKTEGNNNESEDA